MVKTECLQTERLLLRPLCVQDAAAAFAGWAADAANVYYMPYNPHRSLRETQEWLAAEEAKQDSPERCNWGIVERAGGVLIGSIGINLEGRTCEIGYCLAKKYWNQGYMTEAVRGVAQYARDVLQLESIYARVAVTNRPSARVLEKLGFQDAGACTYSSYDGTREFPARKLVRTWEQRE